jgi:sugar phosphate isomerase/epimerase
MSISGYPIGFTHSDERAIGYVAGGMGGRSVQDVIELLVHAGYGAVDWTMEQYDPLTEPPGRLAEIVRSSHAAGLRTPQLLVHQDHVTRDPEQWECRVRRAERAVRACAQAGIGSIGVLTGPCPWRRGAARIGRDLSERDGWELAWRALERVLGCAEQESVRVALEPCRGTLARDRYRAEYTLAALDCPALAVNLDPSHLALAGDDVPGAVYAWGGRIAHVHLNDVFGVPGRRGEDFTFLLPGEGAVPWPELLEALDAMGYDGALCVQDEARRPRRGGPPRGDPARRAAAARELVRELMDPPSLAASRLGPQPGGGGDAQAKLAAPLR